MAIDTESFFVCGQPYAQAKWKSEDFKEDNTIFLVLFSTTRMSFRSIVRDVRDGFGSLSRRGFEVRLMGHHRGKSHGSLNDLHDQPLIVQNSRWASLPPELLYDVIRRLEESESTWPSRKHVVACASVCRSWRTMCKEIVKSPEICGKLTFPVSLKQVESFNPFNLMYILTLCRYVFSFPSLY